MKVLVTGAAGFIGSHVVDALVGRGDEVIGVDSLDPEIYDRPPSYLNERATYRFADLRRWSPGAEMSDTEGVVHLAALGGVSRAAREPGNVVAANVAGTARLVEALSGWPSVARVVVASSFSVYGTAYTYRCRACAAERDGSRRVSELERASYEVRCEVCGGDTDVLPLDESARPAPLELYGASKYMQELCFSGFAAAPVHVLRQSSVYGRRLRVDDGEATIIARMAGWIRQGIRPSLLEDGRQIRDWVHVSDVVAAVTAILDGEEAPPMLNVCTGSPTLLSDAARVIARVSGRGEVTPEVIGGYRDGDMRHCLGDPGLLRKLIAREPLPFDVGAEEAFGPSSGEHGGA